MVVWMSEVALEPGRQYLMQSSNGLSNASVTTIRHRVDINTLEHQQAGALDLNDIALCAITSDRELLFDAYGTNRQTGSFILVDRLTNATVAAGMIAGVSSSWDRAPEASLVRQVSEISADERAARFGQQPCTVLLTGLSAAGKSTIATGLARRLFDLGKTTIRLDGENVRLGISRDLGFSAQERSENLRRVSEVARLVNGQGMIAIAALSAPKNSVRERARELIGSEHYIEVFVDTPIEVCEARDPKGLYAQVREGRLKGFTGIDAPYEAPLEPELRLTPDQGDAETLAQLVIAELKARAIL